jgi:hypothetical protein
MTVVALNQEYDRLAPSYCSSQREDTFAASYLEVDQLLPLYHAFDLITQLGSVQEADWSLAVWSSLIPQLIQSSVGAPALNLSMVMGRPFICVPAHLSGPPRVALVTAA